MADFTPYASNPVNECNEKKSLALSMDDLHKLDQLLKDKYDRRATPTSHLGIATEVACEIYIRSFGSINPATMDFQVDLYLRQRWTDPRFKKLELLNPLDLNDPKVVKKLWKPEVFFANAKDADFQYVTIPNVLVRINPSGEILYMLRLKLTFSCMMDLYNYPMDNQTCHMEIGSFSKTIQELNLTWFKQDPVKLYRHLTLPQFQIVTATTSFCQEDFQLGEYSCLKAELHLSRNIGYHLVQNYIPTTLIVVTSWVSFWIDVNAITARISLGVTTLLTIISKSSNIQANIPLVSYVKAIDIWIVVCITFIFFSLVEFTIVSYLWCKSVDINYSKDFYTPAKVSFKLLSHYPLSNFCMLTCTFGLNEKIRSAALHIGDTKLLAKLSEGDVIAIEMKYHLKCLVSLYNRAKSTACQQPPHNQIYEMYHSIAFAELVTYIEEELTEMITPVIKLANMVKMYSTRLEQLGNLKGERVHSTRLKEKLLAHIPGLQAHKQGKDILFIRDADIGKVLSDAFDKNNDSDAMCLARAAQIIRRDMFQELFSFNGSFSSKYQEIYRSPVLIAIDLANAVCQTYNKANVVIPTSFKTDVFITAAVDNIDHNLSSMAATGSFHGTGISLFQHPDFDGQGNELNNVTITQCSSKKVNPLPDFYTNVPRVGSSLDHGDFEMKLLTNRHRAKMLSRHTKGRILAKKIDTWCRVIFPAAFTVFMLVYWYYYKS
ncbi:Glycine receptor subunit alpha-3 [Nymphon striatum]|nr:Glycine receptor subunit alpha-3 [Nymphon striatum]